VAYLDSLPRQRSLHEVDKHVSECFKVVSAGLLDAEVAVEARVPDGTGDVLVLLVWDVNQSSRISVLFTEAEVNYVYDMRVFV